MDSDMHELQTFRHLSRSSLKAHGTRSEYKFKAKGDRLSYFMDWLFVLLLIFVSIVADPSPAFEKYITEGELASGTYSYPLRPNSFPSWALLPACILFPCLVIVMCMKSIKRTTGRQLHHALLGLFMSLGFTNCLTCFLKLMIGRPRPDFLARCFDNNVPDPIPFSSPGYPACTGDPAVVAEGRRSFPSGHSSLSFGSQWYLTLFLINFLDAFDEEGHPWKLFVASLPSCGALFVAASRVSDYWHHTTDVLAGSLLGILIAYISYKQQHYKVHYHLNDLVGSSYNSV
ncbi:type 2 phosphatidic acid phosphatase [Chloropicon primus]|uniref:Type 2 phosphatidic acid phosphatase n=1 Tax=Chloropicon primus TaxID=1764295 RepID=A0A5B8MWH5_9CHLO|nr:type 2 phosphatidic acid phosphatase [Chloropicon primus]UPR04109.1 type 2 phosphatidic acid phosphatase [Chloropicon primus]|mmetsp:Transcript_4851/g.14477  ORF Transcript_4851/g.14477 Transcript_4851/m.14477 type:complete len:287 (+) Transcript_4851:155-1015(+)|eukprot:QDZ24899.1 type 2 phosphatidic acid phosphatase [Chloropicon primus]